ncbi:type II toxin-antitoxin system RatA family toxin [Stenotrophomonas acidaminiphila]|uniref:type II toxin-antitoxin system RatA family toxin n=1 Tax=Stenotrophomonas acidaminiphila TaxID=128780 RepID=UPI0028A872A7|nr:type II toxin-antitoxin system RatA family toxin [Stenotrophomonas acidaminiphila]
MPIIRRSALVEQPAECMFDLVNDVAAYPRRFRWCEAAQILEAGPERLVARLDLGLGSFRTWFMTENTLQRPGSIDMQLKDGPFKRLHGRWQFQPLSDAACKVSLELEFEPTSRLLGPALALGFQGLADRMVNDFVRVAEQGG